jgi:hypothetical protein
MSADFSVWEGGIVIHIFSACMYHANQSSSLVTSVCCRMCIRVLVKDATKAKQEFGPYVEAVQGDVMTETSLQQAMRSTRVVVMAGACGHAVREAQKFGVEHIVLVSSAGTVPLFEGHFLCF